VNYKYIRENFDQSDQNCQPEFPHSEYCNVFILLIANMIWERYLFENTRMNFICQDSLDLKLKYLLWDVFKM